VRSTAKSVDVKQTSAGTGVVPVRLEANPEDDGQLLVGRLKARDQRAWASVFDAYYPLLCRYGRTRLASQADAEDVASQVFLRALESIDRYDYRNRPLLAWLYTIARNLVNERYRRDAHRTADSVEAAAIEPAPDADLAARIDLRDAVKNLKDEQYETIVLRFSLGLSIRETAEVMSKTEGAVHSLQVRAVEQLRRKLSHPA
jgi:RNA polymerase sigma-70 factor (ECF subfamily)